MSRRPTGPFVVSVLHNLKPLSSQAKHDPVGTALAQEKSTSKATMPLLFEESRRLARQSASRQRTESGSESMPTSDQSPSAGGSGAGRRNGPSAVALQAARDANEAGSPSGASPGKGLEVVESPSSRRSSSLVSRLFRSSPSNRASTYGASEKDAAIQALARFQDTFDADAHRVVRIYRYPDQASRYIALMDATSVSVLLDFLEATWPPANHKGASFQDNRLVLVEVQPSMYVPGEVIQTLLPGSATHLIGERGLCARYYVATRSTLGLGGGHETHETTNFPLPPDAPTLLPEDQRKELLAPSKSEIITAVEPRIIARELAFGDFKYFSAVRPIEYIAFLWKHQNVPHTNVQAFISRFNWIVNWVKTEVLSHRNNVKRRAESVKAFIKIAQYCQRLQDFNALFAIVSGLASPPLTRLKQTWSKVSSKYTEAFEALEQLMDPSRNMYKYRHSYAEACKVCVSVCGGGVVCAIEVSGAHSRTVGRRERLTDCLMLPCIPSLPHRLLQLCHFSLWSSKTSHLCTKETPPRKMDSSTLKRCECSGPSFKSWKSRLCVDLHGFQDHTRGLTLSF